jgi:hypothetical protein
MAAVPKVFPVCGYTTIRISMPPMYVIRIANSLPFGGESKPQ